MNETMQELMREATRLTQSGNLREATQVIQRALGNVGLAPQPQPPPPSTSTTSPPIILDGCVFEVGSTQVEEPEVARPQTPSSSANGRDHNPEGEFVEGSHTHASLTRRYKLYAPPGPVDKSLPLVVMLHGCTQSPDDFAAGTGMNELAKAQVCYVLYPEQSASANPQRCWNWFKHNHQSRGRGEAALLANMTLAVIKDKGIDARRVYIAGLSAGGAMAAIVATAYPEIFAAAGVHSGLAVGAAGNVAEALAAMRSGAADTKLASSISAVPTIVFHGDQDRTVHPRNGQQMSEQVIAALHAGSENSVEQGMSSNGQAFTRTRHLKNDISFVESWVLHGAGHAWSGGNAKGSYTDPSGPDASAEMLRFFSEHVKPMPDPSGSPRAG
jgi:poly(hydroxyalkanoate) depolymerase family esterase